MSRYDDWLRLHSVETDDCVLWPHARNGAGYGMIYHKGRKPLVHRLSCEAAYGPPPTSTHEAAHSCHTPACMNPRHLRWATRSENQLDREKDGTSNHGIRNPQAKLTVFDVQAIRHYAECGTMFKVLAQHYDVSRSVVSEIVNRKAWRHVA